MLRLDAYRHGLASKADEVLDRLTAEGAAARLWVRGPTGAGRHSLVDRLRTDPRVVAVELPDLDDLDIALHGLVQAASQADGLDNLLAAFRQLPTSGVEERARRLAGQLAEANRILVVLLPLSWERGQTGEDDMQVGRQRAEAWLAGITQVSELPIAVMTGLFARSLPAFAGVTPLELQAPTVRPDDIDPSVLSGRFRAAAESIVQELHRSPRLSTPIEIRLRVGLIALGESAQAVTHRQLDALANRLALRLASQPALSAAVRRFLVARQPIAASEVARVSGVTDEMLPLLTTCIGYGNDVIRVAERTRQVLSDHLLRPRSRGHDAAQVEEGHRALAEYHRNLDGENRLDGLTAGEAVHWLEKVHHLARGGWQSQTEWAAQDLLDRGQYWERARYLSREARSHGEAAVLFRECIRRFGEDPYSCHYLAYNLDRGRGPRSEVRDNYQRAVQLESGNAWWNARWVTFLIAHGTFKEAKEAWLDALDNVDPTHDRVEASPWLALHMHRWVVRRWLALGHVVEARAVLDEIPVRWLDNEPALAELQQQVEDHEEALRLGDSVYPASVPITERWTAPGVIPTVSATGHPRSRWWPGRVLESQADHVTVVLADPSSMEAQEATFSGEEWRAMTNEAPSEASGFIVLGEYDGGERMIRRVPGSPAPDLDSEFRYLTAGMKPWLH